MKIMIIDYHDTGTKVQREYQPIFVQHPIPSQKIMTCVGENNNYYDIKKQKQCVSAVPAESEKEPAPGRMWPQFLPNLKKSQ